MEKIGESKFDEDKNSILNSYSAQDPERPHWFIYEWVSGRRVLVEVDSASGKVQFLKEL